MNRLKIISAKSSHGANMRGSELAPDEIKRQGFIAELVRRGIEFSESELSPDNPQFHPSQRERNFEAVSNVCKKVHDETLRALNNNSSFPVVLGGDHSVSCGSILAALGVHEDLCVVWIDSHCDYNTPQTTMTGNIHGMPLASICGKYEKLASSVTPHKKRLDPRRAFLIGVNDIDPLEWQEIVKDKVNIYSYNDFKNRGFDAVKREIYDVLSALNAPVYISMDMDVVSHYFAPGVSCPTIEGFHHQKIIDLLMSFKAGPALSTDCSSDRKSGAGLQIIGFDLTEVNPMTDKNGKTVRLAVKILEDFILSATCPTAAGASRQSTAEHDTGAERRADNTGDKTGLGS